MTELTAGLVFLFSSCLFASYNVILVKSSPSLSSSFQLCHKSDPNLGQCMVDAVNKALKLFKNGSRELSISPLDPFHVDLMDLGETTGSVSLRQKYENVDFFGFSDVWHNDSQAAMEDDNCYLTFKAYGIKEVRMAADYKIQGQVLVFPINGHGKCVNILYGQFAHHKLTCEKYTKKGKKHIRVTKYDLDLSVDSMHFGFENLIETNKQMTDEIVRAINENSKAVFSEVRAGFEGALSQIFMHIFNEFFSKHPESELFLP